MVEGLLLKRNGEGELVYRSNIPVPRWLEEPEHSISEGSIYGKPVADIGPRKKYYFNEWFDVSQVDTKARLSDVIYAIHIKAPNGYILNYGEIIQPRQVVTVKPLPIKVAEFR